jgi:glycosyltransferase involved in cell wall biosynthesis
VHLRHTLKYVWLAKNLFGLRKPIVFHEHYGNIDIDPSVSRIQKIILRKAVVVAVSLSLYRWAKEIANAPRVFLLSNTVVRQKRLESNRGKRGGQLKLVLVANARPTKNIEYAIRLIEYLNTKTKTPASLDIYCQVVDAEYFRKLQEQVRGFGLADKVRFVTDCDNIQAILGNYDMAMHTSRSESTYNTGEVVGQIKTELPELIIDSFEPADWAKKINTILTLDKAELRGRMDNVYNTYYSEQEYFNKCIAIYEASLRS